MKYLKTFEYYTEDYDVILYPGKTYLRVNSVLRQKLLSVINGDLDSFEVKKGKYGNKDLKIYKEDENIVFESEFAKPSISIEDILTRLEN